MSKPEGVFGGFSQRTSYQQFVVEYALIIMVSGLHSGLGVPYFVIAGF